MTYIKDASEPVYCRDDHGSFRYSDGEATEKKLLQFLRGVSDRGTYSSEIQDGINDWPSEYHLSNSRHHLCGHCRFGPEIVSWNSVVDVGR